VSDNFDRILCVSPVELGFFLERYLVVATHKLSVEQHAAPDRLQLGHSSDPRQCSFWYHRPLFRTEICRGSDITLHRQSAFDTKVLENVHSTIQRFSGRKGNVQWSNSAPHSRRSASSLSSSLATAPLSLRWPDVLLRFHGSASFPISLAYILVVVAVVPLELKWLTARSIMRFNPSRCFCMCIHAASVAWRVGFKVSQLERISLIQT
jgi:hypothetical protein